MEFKHPKHYAEMRAERRKLQAASPKDGHKNFFWPTVPTRRDASLKHQASEASSSKPQAPSSKLQASSRKRQAP